MSDPSDQRSADDRSAGFVRELSEEVKGEVKAGLRSQLRAAKLGALAGAIGGLWFGYSIFGVSGIALGALIGIPAGALVVWGAWVVISLMASFDLT